MTVNFFDDLPLDSETEAEMNNLGGGISHDVHLGTILNNLNAKILASDYKESCRAGTTGNIFLSGLPVIDTVALASGDRVLVKNQAVPTQNGIYIASAGVWLRSDDADNDDEVTSGLTTVVEEGTQSTTTWTVSTPDPITLGVTGITFTQVFSTPLSNTAPVNTDNTAAAAGSSTEASRQDHKHDVNFAAGSQGVGGGNVAGSATTVSLSDHDHSLRETGGPTDLTIASVADGQFLRRSGTNIIGSLATSSSVLHFGNNSVTSTTTTRYLTPGYEQSTSLTSLIQYRLPFSGTLKNLRIRHNAPAGNGNAIVYTVRVNGAPTALTVSLPSTSTDGSDVANTVTVVAGDLIDIRITKAASIGVAPGRIMASLEIS